jgi:hypothetical protein
MRLKHMVKDKINYRALGPRTALTKQPVSGRANDGGLRIGEMERDSVLGHGISEFLRESMMERGDEYQMVVCNTTGALAIYNKARDLFMSPMADGPLRFFRSETGKGFALDTMTKYGRRFSVISIPYSLKLLIQELAAINIQLRIVTEDNLPQIDSMAFSDNLNKLTIDTDMTPDKLVKEMERALRTGERAVQTPRSLTSMEEEEYDKAQATKKENQEKERERRERESELKKEYPETSPAYEPPEGFASEYPETSPAYVPDSLVSDSLDNGSFASDSFVPDSPVSDSPASDSVKTTGGSLFGKSAQTVSDFELGEQVYFTGSVDVGLPHDQIWSVAKKGGTLLTLTANRDSMMGGGGGISTNMSNSKFVQIVKADEAVKHDTYNAWEAQRAGARQQAEARQQMVEQWQPPTPQVPQINIKMVGGNDFSKGPDSNGHEGKETQGMGGAGENGISISGGSGQDAAFNSLVIPSMKGGGGKKDEPEKSSEKTIFGSAAELSRLVINKIM